VNAALADELRVFLGNGLVCTWAWRQSPAISDAADIGYRGVPELPAALASGSGGAIAQGRTFAAGTLTMMLVVDACDAALAGRAGISATGAAR